MPSEANHISVAIQNRIVIDHLLKDSGNCTAWIATVAFYRAVHIAEALFAKEVGTHHTSHDDRHDKLKRNYKEIWMHYRPIYAASLVARYLADDQGKEFSSFTDYLTLDGVKASILNFRLKEIEQIASKRLTKEQALRLLSPPATQKP